jgi:hypothetical protein
MRKTKEKRSEPAKRREQIPPGATRKAFERENLGGGPAGSPLGDPHAAGDPAGGAEFGGLAGSNIGDGSPVESVNENEDQPPFAGPAGGAVGGTPAEGRSSGGHTHRGLAPGGNHRGDSTIGSDPSSKRGG